MYWVAFQLGLCLTTYDVPLISVDFYDEIIVLQQGDVQGCDEVLGGFVLIALCGLCLDVVGWMNTTINKDRRPVTVHEGCAVACRTVVQSACTGGIIVAVGATSAPMTALE